MKTETLPDRVSAKTLGELIGVSDRQIRNYASEGVIPAGVNGRFDLSSSIRALLARAHSKQSSDGEAARVALTREKANAVALANARKRGELVPLEELHQTLDVVMAEIRNAIQGLPARVTRDMDLRRKLDAAVTEVLTTAASAIERRAGELEGRQ